MTIIITFFFFLKSTHQANREVSPSSVQLPTIWDMREKLSNCPISVQETFERLVNGGSVLDENMQQVRKCEAVCSIKLYGHNTTPLSQFVNTPY